ncbi:MAG: hypothetical protein AAFQ99_12095 [Pseudomonadota bacterium]
MDDFLRIGIAWRGSADLDLHALEFGSVQGSENHIWSGNTRDYRGARKAGGGYLDLLGDDIGQESNKVEVYSLPRSSSTGTGLIDFSVVADAGEMCSSDIQLTTIRAIGAQVSTLPINVQDLQDCAQSGEIIVQSAVQDLQIRRN